MSGQMTPVITKSMKSKLFLLKAAIPFVSILLLVAGILQLRGQFWASGAICLVFAMAGILYSMRFPENTPFTQEELEILRPLIVPAILWTVILSLLTLSVVYVADNFISRETNRISSLAWIVSVMLGLIVTWGVHWNPNLVSRLLNKIKANRRELSVLLLVLGLAFALRTIDLSTHPYPWSGDEASIGSDGLRILNGDITNFFETGWSSQSNWSFVPTAISEAIFGKTIFAIRLPSALAGTMAVLFLYLAARELFGPTIALLAGAFLAALPYQVHFSRVGVHNVVDSFMSALVFWLIARGVNKDDARYYYLAGAAAGLSLYTYAGTRLVLVLGVATLLFLVIRQKGYFSSHRKHLLSFVGGAFVSMAPQVAFFARHPDIFMGRFGQEGIFFNGWLVQQSASTGKSALQILLNQFMRTILVFIATPASGNFLNFPYPYLTMIGSILFLFGMGYALAYAFKLHNFILLVWFWAVILFGGVLTLNPPANTRLVMTAPAVALMMALGIYKLVEYLQKFKIVPQRVVVFIFVAIACVITYQNVQFYMVEYKNNSYFQDANGEFALEVGQMAQKLGTDFQIYVLGAPRVFSGFPTFSFLIPDNLRIDLNAENLASVEIGPGQSAGFFAIPDNDALLTEISQKYPDGESGRVYRIPKPDEVLFEYYIIKH